MAPLFLPVLKSNNRWRCLDFQFRVPRLCRITPPTRRPAFTLTSAASTNARGNAFRSPSSSSPSPSLPCSHISPVSKFSHFNIYNNMYIMRRRMRVMLDRSPHQAQFRRIQFLVKRFLKNFEKRKRLNKILLQLKRISLYFCTFSIIYTLAHKWRARNALRFEY